MTLFVGDLFRGAEALIAIIFTADTVDREPGTALMRKAPMLAKRCRTSGGACFPFFFDYEERISMCGRPRAGWPRK
jgi:hypothetical protein